MYWRHILVEFVHITHLFIHICHSYMSFSYLHFVQADTRRLKLITYRLNVQSNYNWVVVFTLSKHKYHKKD
jgi:hypothetical protein